jgi:hypothetical protein
MSAAPPAAKPDDRKHWADRIGLRSCEVRRSSDRGKLQECATGKFHGAPLMDVENDHRGSPIAASRRGRKVYHSQNCRCPMPLPLPDASASSGPGLRFAFVWWRHSWSRQKWCERGEPYRRPPIQERGNGDDPAKLHNHPSGDPTPSQAAIQMTRAIVDIAGPLGISVHDHIIVGKNGHASLKGLKLM